MLMLMLRRQNGFVHPLGTSLILVVIIIIALAGYKVFNNSKQQNQGVTSSRTESKISTEASNKACNIKGKNVEPALASASGAFSSPVTDITKLSVIANGNNVSGDSRFSYMTITNAQEIPVYAPADGRLITIYYKNRSDLPSSLSKPDYDVVFLVDCKTAYQINHITKPISELAQQAPVSQPIELTPGHPATTEQITPKSNLLVKAGQSLGTTTGTVAAHNWDFGVFVNNNAVCPYSVYEDPLKSAWLKMFGPDGGGSPDGTDCQASGALE